MTDKPGNRFTRPPEIWLNHIDTETLGYYATLKIGPHRIQLTADDVRALISEGAEILAISVNAMSENCFLTDKEPKP